MKISFGMIFSIILIIIFIAFATYAIFKFIDMQQGIQVDIFKNDFQDNVKAVWLAPKDNPYEVEYYLPDKIDAVCFTDDEYENLYFEPDDIIFGEKIEHLDIGVDFCIDNIDGKVSMTLIKEEILVRIE